MIVLDAWAVLAVTNDEAPRPRIVALIAEHGARMSWINLGEVYYRTEQQRDRAAAERSVRLVRSLAAVAEPDEALVIDAARIKARGGMSYADCFAVATAARHREPLLTADPEIIASAGDVRVIDPR